MIQNESLREEKSCLSNGSLQSHGPGQHKFCLLKRLYISVNRHYSVTIPSNTATAESHVAASSYKVWALRCLKAGPPASYCRLQPGALARIQRVLCRSYATVVVGS